MVGDKMVLVRKRLLITAVEFDAVERRTMPRKWKKLGLCMYLLGGMCSSKSDAMPNKVVLADAGEAHLKTSLPKPHLILGTSRQTAPP